MSKKKPRVWPPEPTPLEEYEAWRLRTGSDVAFEEWCVWMEEEIAEAIVVLEHQLRRIEEATRPAADALRSEVSCSKSSSTT